MLAQLEVKEINSRNFKVLEILFSNSRTFHAGFSRPVDTLINKQNNS
jgi:hypothetical protein